MVTRIRGFGSGGPPAVRCPVVKAILPILMLVLLVAGWLLLSARDSSIEEGTAIDRAAEEDEAVRDLVTLRGRDGATTPEAEHDASTPAVPPMPAVAPVETGRYVLHGTLLGLDATRPGEARVQVFPVSGMWANRDAEPSTCVAGTDGRFTVDLGTLFAQAEGLTHVEIVVDHPACVETLARLDVTAVRAAGHGVLEATLLLRAGLALTGEVVGQDRVPVAEADVALFRMGKDGPEFERMLPVQPRARTRTDAAGRYRLRVAGPGRYLVVAAHEGRRSAGLKVSLSAGAEVEIAPLVLETGVAIAGRLLYQGEPVGQAYVQASASDERDGLPLQVGSETVQWSAEGLVSDGAGRTDDAGAFSLVGLSRGGYALGVWHVTLSGIHAVSYVVTQHLGGTIQAPAEDVVLEIAGAVLELRTTCGGESAGTVGLQVQMPITTTVWETDEHGVLRVLVPAGQEYRISVGDEAYQPAHWTVTSGAVGATVVHELALVRAAPKPSLLVTFEGPGAAALDRAWIELAPPPAEPSDAPGAAPPPPVGLNPEAEKIGPGVFRLNGLSAGRFTLIARPGTDFWENVGYQLEIRREIVLPPEGELELRLALRVGGRLQIAARDAAGALLEADCVIKDGAGEAQAVTFCTHSEHVAMTQSDALGNLSPSYVAPPLPPGRYTIELSLSGHEPQTVEVDVKENETTKVDVTLGDR